MKLHFVGIGGIGMSGIAEVLLNQGYEISGSDIGENDQTLRLLALGAKITKGHSAQNVQGSKVVVISSAVKDTNPEILEAKRLKIPVIPRAEMLAELMRGKTGIAVAGTHGKTTTTTMIATILSASALDPTIIVGGKVDSIGSNAKLGKGKFLLAEADESDGSFLRLPYTYGVITNIDNDHLDFYQKLTEIDAAFITFVSHAPFYGRVAVCIDDDGVQRISGQLSKPFVTYGQSLGAEYRATDLVSLPDGWTLNICFEKDGSKFAQPIKLNALGLHNVLNATGAFAICHQIGISPENISLGLSLFSGVKRRFDVRWMNQSKTQAIVDDYGHHPTEIKATLMSAKQFWPSTSSIQRRVICVFQPHRYSRTLHCIDEFKSAFIGADLLWLSDIYPAGELPIEGVTSGWLTKSIQLTRTDPSQVRHCSTFDQILVEIKKEFRKGDLLLCMGAGSITKFPELLIKALNLDE